MTSSSNTNGNAAPDIEITFLEKRGGGVFDFWSVEYLCDGKPWASVCVRETDELGVFKYLLNKHGSK